MSGVSKRGGGQRGLAQGKPSHTIDSGVFLQPFSYATLMSRRTQFWGTNFVAFGELLVANPLPPTPFKTSDYFVGPKNPTEFPLNFPRKNPNK